MRTGDGEMDASLASAHLWMFLVMELSLSSLSSAGGTLHLSRKRRKAARCSQTHTHEL